MSATEPTTAAFEFVWRLIEAANSPLLEAELGHALRRARTPRPPDPATRRLQTLGALRGLIDKTGKHPTRELYDASRASAPSSHALVDRYPSWWQACEIAAHMREDGTLPRGRTFGDGRRARTQRAAPYTLDELIGAVRLCAFSLGRRPSFCEYARWRLALTDRARQRGETTRVPSTGVIYRIVRHRTPWAALLGMAALCDQELQVAHAETIGYSTPGDPTPFLDLPISIASNLAAQLGGSLDWLAGRTAGREPRVSTTLRLDPQRLRAFRDQSTIPARDLARAAGLTTGESRRLLSGTYEPTLAVVVSLASVLGVSAADLCTTRS